MIPHVVALQGDLVGPAIVLGIAAAGLYGLLAMSIVLTYRVSRTIGFVQGGIALFAMFVYWWLTGLGNEFGPERIGRIPAALITVVVGAALGVVYGWTMTGRLANWPRIKLTVYSLGWLLALSASIILLFLRPGSGFQSAFGISVRLPSLFGTSRYEVMDVVVTIHQVATVAILVVLMGLLSFVLLRTRTGTFIRAIADDPDASRWVGIPLSRVGTAVYGFSGALAAFGGVLMTTTIGLDFFLALVVFLRALTVSVLGGFRSLPLALVGCLVLGVGESMFAADGTLTQAQREMVIMGVLFGLVLVINRFRPIAVIEATGQ